MQESCSLKYSTNKTESSAETADKRSGDETQKQFIAPPRTNLAPLLNPPSLVQSDWPEGQLAVLFAFSS